MVKKESLKILFLAAEVAPFAKTGGLADVAGSLPKVIHELGHDVRVTLPAYRRIDRRKSGLRQTLEPFPVPMDTRTQSATVFTTTLGQNVPVYFIDNPHYFDRENIYMYKDDAERFIFFCRAALQMCKHLPWRPDVIHCHDWHTAIVPNWLGTVYAKDPFFADTATVYTIHNLQYQGVFGPEILQIAGLDEYEFGARPEAVPDLNEVVNLMARGIVFADVINTVSPTYARQILTPEYGERLDPVLRNRRDQLYGILNGIDTEAWNPATDERIVRNYDVNTLDRRIENKRALQAECQLPQDSQIPLIGIITRLVNQKGLDVLEKAIEPILALDVQFVLLGTGEPHYRDMLRRVADRHRDKVAVFLTFNAPLAGRIYAGSDMFLMPSRFEPCGLGQMIAMRYGSVPVVRATGGLADTVHDFDPRTGEGNGFAFETYDPWALFAAVVRAVENYRYTDTWRRLQTRGMRSDFSWRASAQKYVELYYRALSAHHASDRTETYDLGSRNPAFH